MKRLILLTTLLAASLTMSALPIDVAQREALFLTDKMAYELELTDEQYELAYEINLDYFLSINHRGDILGTWWTRRNADLRYILSDFQYNLFIGLSYFYRPISWYRGGWYYPIYTRYVNRSYYYRPRPHGYTIYRGGHNRIHGHYNRPIHRPGGAPGRHGAGPGRIGGGPGGPGGRPGGNYNYGGGRPGGNYGGGRPGGNYGGSRPGGNYGGSRPGGNYGGDNGGSRPSGGYNGGNSGSRPSGGYNGGYSGSRPSGGYNGGGSRSAGRPSFNGGGGSRPSSVRSGQPRSSSVGRTGAPGRRR
jgi:hypothetical protein